VAPIATPRRSSGFGGLVAAERPFDNAFHCSIRNPSSQSLPTVPLTDRSESLVKGIDRIGPAYYTLADGDGQTTATCEADLDVGGAQDLPRSAAHPFYMRLNQILDNHDFDGYVEGVCLTDTCALPPE
jgi:hypothetical protein